MEGVFRQNLQAALAASDHSAEPSRFSAFLAVTAFLSVTPASLARRMLTLILRVLLLELILLLMPSSSLHFSFRNSPNGGAVLLCRAAAYFLLALPVLPVAEEACVLLVLLVLHAAEAAHLFQVLHDEAALSIHEAVFLLVLRAAEAVRLFQALCDEAALSIRAEAACPCDA